VADAVGILDVYGIAAAHVVGVSAGGALAQLLAIGFPDRRECSRVAHVRLTRQSGAKSSAERARHRRLTESGLYGLLKENR
jgi:pimeloyl-ACP methyl ester carboxylesterase